MRKFWFPGLVGLLLLILAACGSSATAVPAAKQAPAAPAAAAKPAAPAAAAQPAAPAAAAQPAAPVAKAAPAAASLAQVAAKLAGGPGAIFVGDVKQLAGPAPAKELGNADGNVTLDALQRHLWIYQSDYYKRLLEKARLDNPTPLVSKGGQFKLQHACLSRPQPPCQVINTYLAPNILKRTEGQVELNVSSYPELGIAGPDTVTLVRDGTLGMSEIYGGFVAGEVPALEVFYLFGLFSVHEKEFQAQGLVLPDLDRILSQASGGGVVLGHNWYSGNDQYILSKKPLRTLDDFKGTKIRVHSATLSDALIPLGAVPQFITPADVYAALDRGVVDAAVAGPTFGYNLKWYEVTKYLVGPYRTFPATFIVINKEKWGELPADIQQILIEEGAKSELEALRLSAIQNEIGTPRILAKGMTELPFSAEVANFAFDNALIKRMIPNWAKRAGGPDNPNVKLFNEKIGPIAGVKINPDGTASVIGGPKPAAVAAVAAPPLGLAAYAAQYAGKPGAIYLGDLKQLVGPAPVADLGDKAGNVPLDSLQRHKWIYDGDYYKKLLVTAKLENPTPLTTKGKSFKIQYACINRTLLPCKLMEAYFEPNVVKRTDGQVKIDHSSYPELGIAGPDTLRLVADGTLSLSEIYGGFVSGDLPVAEIFYFWGLYPSHEAEYRAQWDIIPAVDQFISKGAGGAKVITHNWYGGNDQYLFAKKPLRTLEDFKGAKVRSHGTTMSDWIEGMGGQAQFVTFAEVYTALERGILDAGLSGATAGHGLRWYEVAKYLVGPFRSFPADFIILNKGIWDKLPPDIQQILIEEGAKQELEGLRLSAIQNELGLSKNTEAGMEHVPFSPEVQAYQYENSIIKRMIPNWVKRVGGADKPEVALFNQVIGPIAGVKVNPDGSVTKIPITK